MRGPILIICKLNCACGHIIGAQQLRINRAYDSKCDKKKTIGLIIKAILSP